MSISKRLEKARKSYEQHDLVGSKQAHEKQSIEEAQEEHASPNSQYIGSMIYGGLDGIITTFAVVSGVAGAKLDPGIILILGLANLFGDGFSMATGAYLSSKSEKEYYDRERQREMWEVETFPDGERHELASLYKKQGYTEEDVAKLVEIKTRNKEQWVDAMMLEELSMTPATLNPIKEGLVTFGSFVIAGALPLLFYMLDLVFGFNLGAESDFLVAVALSGAALFVLGALKYFVIQRNPIRSGLEMLLVGGLAAGVAYLIGALLKGLVGSSG